ncbi:DUF559 domain-containing protein [Conexibacter sp. SYSU D00693]|uniref:DUF559 domain-containing protein n=1 Tax=Conexibacter sp. SYSU D00693 TaxID=2812560 RepID=UPI00196AD528|nr:DUF559 domain-containing protein [Conexibacter sp. SYSU D00693]
MDRDPAVSGAPDRNRQAQGRDHQIAGLATLQRGSISREQLLELGLPETTIESRLKSGSLRPRHFGIYGVGHDAVHPRGPWTAAVLAGGDDAVLSHRTAAALWALGRAPETVVDITVPVERARRRAGLRVCVRELPPQDRTERDGIPCTSVARTLLDLAERVRPSLLTAACEATVREQLFDGAAIAELLDRSRGHRGARRLRRAVSQLTDDPDILRSILEERLRELLEGSALREMPRFNRHAAGASGTLWEVDAVWRSRRLVVEADSRAFHGTRSAQERDARKQRDLEAAGWEVWRVRWSDVHRATGDLLGALDRRLRA